jgi:hypothetical protein
MKLIFTGSYDVDIEKEKKRIKQCFKGDIRQRQMNLLDLFVAGKLNEWCVAFNKLPYDDDNECSEKEYVGLYSEILRDFQYAKFELVEIKIEQ